MRKSYKLPQQIEFCMYSLGDSSYGDDFGMTARKLRQRLRMLGAVEIAEIGLGDDQDKQGYRDVYLSGWRDNVCKYLRVCVKEQ
jgi:sulfite reductase alpha subunit-like flavoprotein